MNPNTLPLLQTILEQQGEISKRLGALIVLLEKPREPIEPTLRSILEPLGSKIGQLSRLVTQPTASAPEASATVASETTPRSPQKSAADYLTD